MQSFFEVPDELLASAVSKLEKVNLNGSVVTNDQCIRVLDASLSSTTLVKVDLSNTFLNGVPTQLLVEAACRLKSFKLLDSDLTADQSLHLLEGMGSSSTLVSVNLEGIDLSIVPAWMLNKAVCRLEAVNLSGTELTTYQSIQLLKSILSSERLTKLNLSSVDLREVLSELISRVLCRLSAVNLGEHYDGEHCLTVLQCAQILGAISTSFKLVKLSLTGDLSPVSAELLTNAIGGLQTVDLSGASLSTGQCVAFLEAVLASKTMTRVYLDSVNLSELPSGLLVRAVQELKTWTYLHGNQITHKVSTDKLASLPPHVYAEHNDD